MCPLLVPVIIGFFLLWPLTVLMKQTRQAVRAIKQSRLLRCLWGLPSTQDWEVDSKPWSHFHTTSALLSAIHTGETLVQKRKGKCQQQWL